MKKGNLKDRLNEALILREKKAVDLTKDLGIPKSAISQYLSGKSEPSQNKLVVLGMALGVQESWLMGFDVRAERSPEINKELAIADELSSTKQELLNLVSDLSESEAAILLASLKSTLGKL